VLGDSVLTALESHDLQSKSAQDCAAGLLLARTNM